MKITKIGELHNNSGYRGHSLYKITYDKSVDYLCEHCGNKKGKSYFFISETADIKGSGGIEWCALCATTFRLKK